jgi:hypothetical protein
MFEPFAGVDMRRAVDGVVQGLEGSPSVQQELEACLAWLDSVCPHLPGMQSKEVDEETVEGEPSLLQPYHPGHLVFAKHVIESKQVMLDKWSRQCALFRDFFL